MIVSLETARAYVGAPEWSDELLADKIRAVEELIRRYTNNRFQNRRVRFYAESTDGALDAASPYLQAGDTVEIGESVNEGIYTVTEAAEGRIRLDRPLYGTMNMVTKIEYPDDVRMGALNLLKWDATGRDKVGVKSETISRHSVSYYDMDVVNSAAGYPAALLGFLEPYQQPRC